MSQLKERVAYLQGLVEGLDITDSTKEGKAIKVISDVLKEMACAIEELAEAHEDLEDYIDSIDDDLSDVEDEVYGEDFAEVTCPNCGAAIEVDILALEDPETEVICPECGEAFTSDDVDWDEDLDDWDEDEEELDPK